MEQQKQPGEMSAWSGRIVASLSALRCTGKSTFFRIQRIASGAGVVAVLLLASGPAHGLMLFDRDGVRLEMELHTVGRMQALRQDASIRQVDADGETTVRDARSKSSPAFQHAIGNIGWRFFYHDYLEVFFDATMASRVAADKWWGHQGYMLVRQLPEDSPVAGFNRVLRHIDVKAGQFVVDFGNERFRRSYNADVRHNPLVGNPIVSPHATEVGVEIVHQNPRGFGVMAGFGSGVATENFDEDSRLSYRGKLWAGPSGPGGVEAALSLYHVQHGSGIARGSNLFRTERLGGQYAGVWDDGNAPGQVMIGDGTNLTAWQLDSGWNPTERLAIRGYFGQASDDQGQTDEAWNYYGATGQYFLLPDALSLACRYSAANARRFQGSSANDGMLDRWQAGGGLHVMEGVLLKVEYVSQRSSGFREGSLAGVDLGERPKFSGMIAEVSFSF